MKTMISFTVFIILCVFPGYTHAQWITISGYVRHSVTDVAIENASIFEKHSEIGTISNRDGFFKLMLNQGRQNLSFSENGYKTFSESLVLKRDTTLIVHLKPEISPRNRHRSDTELEAGAQKKKNGGEDKRFHLF